MVDGVGDDEGGDANPCGGSCSASVSAVGSEKLEFIYLKLQLNLTIAQPILLVQYLDISEKAPPKQSSHSATVNSGEH